MERRDVCAAVPCGQMNFLLITANVGSIFEDMEKTLKQWLRKCLKTIARISPHFIAIHCQEVGGKSYESSMHHVEHFVKTLLSTAELEHYDRARVFLDEDFTAEDKFTALGSFYFVHESVKEVDMWSFAENQFIPLQAKMVHSGNIETIPILEKLKFPFNYFPECLWSRKGYMRTRWRFGGSQIMDMVNIHLFHDASNLTALETSPSPYGKCRENALRFVLDRLDGDSSENVPRFIFGDFNFRLDSHQLVRSLLQETEVHETTLTKTGKVSRLEYKASNKVLLTVESKVFEHRDHEQLFTNNFVTAVRQFDREPKAFSDRLFELPISFPPSYPFSEDADDGRSYMKTRCPSWCDRVMMNAAARDLVMQDQELKYYVIGDNVCMGDHKPVYLVFRTARRASAPAAEPPVDDEVTPAVATAAAARRISRIISINGEEVDANELHEVSILCNATFENASSLTDEFRKRLDRRAFNDVACSAVTVAHAVRHWRDSASSHALSRRRRRRHSSSAESSEVEVEESAVAAEHRVNIIRPAGHCDGLSLHGEQPAAVVALVSEGVASAVTAAPPEKQPAIAQNQ